MKTTVVTSSITAWWFFLAAAMMAPCATDAAPRMANTVWFVVFNAPENCVAAAGDNGGVKCGMLDIFGAAYIASVDSGNPDPTLISPNTAAGMGVIYGAGGYSNRNGKLRVSASLWRTASDTLVSDPAVDPMGLGVGWTNRDGAEIHLVIRSHGERVWADFRSDLVQLTQFSDPYCSDPNLGHVGALSATTGNICKDIQTIAYAAGSSPKEVEMVSLASGKSLGGTRIVLRRNGDNFRVFIDTNVRL